MAGQNPLGAGLLLETQLYLCNVYGVGSTWSACVPQLTHHPLSPDSPYIAATKSVAMAPIAMGRAIVRGGLGKPPPARL